MLATPHVMSRISEEKDVNVLISTLCYNVHITCINILNLQDVALRP